jgi:hypothetical protein
LDSCSFKDQRNSSLWPHFTKLAKNQFAFELLKKIEEYPKPSK